MRVFLCAYPGFSLAIPMDYVSSIYLPREEAENPVETGEKRAFISLPRILKCPEVLIRHGIIIKNKNDDNLTENSLILLSAEIKNEKEISSSCFYPVPKTFGGLGFSVIFDGMFFCHSDGKNSAGKSSPNEARETQELILLLNPGLLFEYARKELIHD